MSITINASVGEHSCARRHPTNDPMKATLMNPIEVVECNSTNIVHTVDERRGTK
jgi:hypothetical protein